MAVSSSQKAIAEQLTLLRDARMPAFAEIERLLPAMQAHGEAAALAWLVAREVTQRLYETLDVLAHQTFGSLRQRVAHHLLDIAACQGQGSRLLAPITQQAIADAVGSVRPAVARVVAQLRNQGLIETTPGGVVVLDAARLFDEVFPRVE